LKDEEIKSAVYVNTGMKISRSELAGGEKIMEASNFVVGQENRRAMIETG
jgi:hypothetical protein